MIPDAGAARGLAFDGWYGNGANPQRGVVWRADNAPPQPINAQLVDYSRAPQPVHNVQPIGYGHGGAPQAVHIDYDYGHGGAQRVSAPPIDGHNAHERSRAAMALLDRGAAAAPRGRPRAPLPESSSPQSSLLEPGKYPDTLSGAHVEISNMRKEMQRLADRVARLEAQLGGA